MILFCTPTTNRRWQKKLNQQIFLRTSIFFFMNIRKIVDFLFFFLIRGFFLLQFVDFLLQLGQEPDQSVDKFNQQNCPVYTSKYLFMPLQGLFKTSQIFHCQLNLSGPSFQINVRSRAGGHRICLILTQLGLNKNFLYKMAVQIW